jgi:hypothetical protein
MGCTNLFLLRRHILQPNGPDAAVGIPAYAGILGDVVFIPLAPVPASVPVDRSRVPTSDEEALHTGTGTCIGYFVDI